MDVFKSEFTKLQQEIFSLLCMKTGEKLSQRDISKLLNVSPTAIGKSLGLLHEKKFISIEKIKNINFILLNREKKEIISLKKIENLKHIYLSGLALYLQETLAGATIILFGSFAKGEDNYKSDIDIAVVGRNKKPVDFRKFEQQLNKDINVNFYSSWKEIHKHLKNNILNGILLNGSIEL